MVKPINYESQSDRKSLKLYKSNSIKIIETKEITPGDLTPRSKFIFETFPTSQTMVDPSSSVLELPIFDRKIERLKSFSMQNNNLGNGEIILDEFSCALKKTVLIQGKIYISSEAIYFHSYFNDSLMFLSKIGTKFKFLISDIKDITKAKNAIIFDNSIEFKLLNDQKVFFTSFLRRD